METKYTYKDFIEIIRKLRAEDGCPWDRIQTHESLRPCMTEEAYEFLSSVRILEETGSADNMREELGDIMLQVVMHSQIAEEEGYFTMEDVIDEVARKMVRRHPHVFKDVEANTTDAVLTNWDAIKSKEKEGKDWIETPLREIPRELPSLARAPKVLKKVNKLYRPLPSQTETLEQMRECIARLDALNEEVSKEALESEIGTLLIAVSTLAAQNKIYTEQVLDDRIQAIVEKYEPNSKKS